MYRMIGVIFAILSTPLVMSAHGQDIARLMQPGISRELADYRATRIANVRYDLRLDVTNPDTATGHVTITFDRTGTGDVILDFRGPTLGNAVVNGKALASVTHNGAHLRLPAGVVTRGTNTVTFDFTALIAPSGASIIRFHDTNDSTTYLYTLLVPADANQLFPCFDQPDLKARVTLALTVPPSWTAVANGALIDSTSTTSKVFRFAETPPLSTYLISFAAGPWTRVTRTIDGREISMYVRASRAKEAEADTLIAANARAAAWLAEYFGVQFPFPKLDFVLAPAFPFGGMEHPGAIFYTEDRFIFRERPTEPQLLSREETIYHEIAHQWFGDLVTMRWFDDLWLKEGFATYMASKMQAALRPTSDAWKTFYLRNKPVAYAVDMTEGTNSVWQPLGNLDQAKSNYGPIVYNKAPGIIKQLNYLVGDSAFRDGLHAFLTKHAYANATWRDLLAAIGTAAKRPLDDWGKQYILRPGMPRITQTVSASAHESTGVDITLTQSPVRPLSGRGAWPIRTEVLVAPATRSSGAPLRIPVELRTDRVRVPLPAGTPTPAFVFANANDYAYASLALDPNSVTWLVSHIGEIDDALLRAMAWGALWDLVRDAQMSPLQYLDIAARELPREADEQSSAAILARVVRAAAAYLSPAQQDSVLPDLAWMLRAGVSDTSKPYGIRKAHLDALIASVGDATTVRYLDALLDSTAVAGEPLRAPTRWAIVTKLVELNAPTADARFAAEVRRDSTSDGKRRAFIAGAARPTAENKRSYFTRYLSDPSLNEDWATASLSAFNSLRAQRLTLPYLRPALDTLAWVQQNRRIFFLGSWLAAFLNGHTSDDALRVTQEFLRANPKLPEDLRRKVLQAMDELERAVAIRRKYAAE